jgi:hypothetical protein
VHYVHSALPGAPRFIPAMQRALRLPAVFASFSSKPWFRAYSRALLESDPALADVYIRDAVVFINQKLHEPDLDDHERDAMRAATHYLKLIKNSATAKRA